MVLVTLNTPFTGAPVDVGLQFDEPTYFVGEGGWTIEYHGSLRIQVLNLSNSRRNYFRFDLVSGTPGIDDISVLQVNADLYPDEEKTIELIFPEGEHFISALKIRGFDENNLYSIRVVGISDDMTHIFWTGLKGLSESA